MKCRVCGAKPVPFADFGHQALAGAFIKPEQIPNEKRYHLELEYCPVCYLVQVREPVEPETLFHHYFYLSGQIQAVREHLFNLAEHLVDRYQPKEVLEIGCNDGYLLSRFADAGVKCIGVDPAFNAIAGINDKRIKTYNEYFDMASAKKIIEKHGKQKLIVANNVLAHAPDILGTAKALSEVIHEDGIAVVELHSLEKMINEMQYDWVYHEHVYYWSALAFSRLMQRVGLEIIAMDEIPAHGGSRRYYLRTMRNGTKWSQHRVEQSAIDVCLHEYKSQMHKAETFIEWGKQAKLNAALLHKQIYDLVAEGKMVCGYGASGRANTILQTANIDHRLLAFIIDDAPSKQGFLTPGTHIPIYAIERAPRADEYLILAWPYARHIMGKIGTGAILPRMGAYL